MRRAPQTAARKVAHRAPPWWPENEPWPPVRGSLQWRRHRARFVRRAGAGLSLLLFLVVLVLVAFIGLGGDTPEGDDSARKVVSYYADNETKEIIAAVVLALSTVPLLFFSATLRDRFRVALPGRSALPGFAYRCSEAKRGDQEDHQQQQDKQALGRPAQDV